MHLLYHWRGDNYRQDLKAFDHFHLNQNSKRLLSIAPGQHVWAFTRCLDGRYVLVADLIATCAVHNPPGNRYGRYRVYGDVSRSRYFDALQGPDVTGLVARIAKVKESQPLGRSFQGPGAVRTLDEHEHMQLAAFAADLALEPSIHGASSTRRDPLEPAAGLLVAEPQATAWASPVQAILPLGAVDLPDPSMSPTRREYLLQKQYMRNQRYVAELQDLYHGRCQICEWEPQHLYARRVCEGHHIHWLSQGGADAFSNLLLVCPNHHRAIHATGAQLDYHRLEMVFGTRREAVQLNEHLQAAS